MGWIKLDRKIQDHWLWQKKPFSEGQAWIDLIMLANHEDEKFMYRGRLVNGKRGTVYRSMLSLSERWGWSRKKVKRFLSVLESDGMLTINATTQDTTICLINYGIFQDKRTTKGTTKAQQKNSGSTTKGTYTRKNTTYSIKEEKEDKERASADFRPSGDFETDPDDYLANYYKMRGG